MLKRLIAAQNRRNWHPYSFLLFCAFVGLMRGILEIMLQGIPLYNSDIFNFIPFYVLLGLLLTVVLSATAGVSFQTVQKSLTIGLFMGLFPPLFDFILFRNSSAFYGYYYIWDFAHLPYAGYKPDFNFPAGETFAIWISIVFCGAYVFTVSRSVVRALAALVGAYLVFILMGSLLPMLVARFSGVILASIDAARATETSTLRALAFRIAFYQSLGSVVIYLLLRRDLSRHIIRRSLHILPFAMLTLLGGAAVHANATVLLQSTLIIAVSGIVILAQNDYFDALETGNAPTAVAQKYDVQILNVLFFLCLVPLFMQNNRGAVAVAVVFVCGVLYNYPLYRARNYFPANLKIEGVWGLSAFLAGALTEPHTVARPEVVLTAFLVFGGWSSVSVLKDLKDAEDDQRLGVRTFFTVFMNRGKTLSQIWRILRWLLIGFILIPVGVAFTVMPSLQASFLGGLTLVLAATFWFPNYRLAFQLQLILVSALIGFWQAAFWLRWIALNP